MMPIQRKVNIKPYIRGMKVLLWQLSAASPSTFKCAPLFHVLSRPQHSTPLHHPPPFYPSSLQRRMNTWMTIACVWRQRFVFAGAGAVREQFTGGGSESASQMDCWATKIPDRALPCEHDWSRRWRIPTSLPAHGAACEFIQRLFGWLCIHLSSFVLSFVDIIK